MFKRRVCWEWDVNENRKSEVIKKNLKRRKKNRKLKKCLKMEDRQKKKNRGKEI